MVVYKWDEKSLGELEKRYQCLFETDYSTEYTFLPSREKILEDATNWYPGVKEWTLEISRVSGIEHEFIAAVMAVLSAQTSVDNNIKFTLQAVGEYVTTGIVRLENVAQTPDNVNKAISILQYGDLTEVKGRKIQAFADNILNGNDSNLHTTDVHMWRALRPLELLERKTPQPCDFEAIQLVAEKISKNVGLHVPALQAYVWCVVRSISYGFYNTSTTLPSIPVWDRSYGMLYDMYVA